MIIWLFVPYEPLPIIDKTGRDLRYLILAKELAKNTQNEVVFWTSDFDHVRKSSRFGFSNEVSLSHNLRIRLLYAGTYSKNISFSRIKHNIRLADEFVRQLKIIDARPDIIVCCIPTLELGDCVVKFAYKNQIPVIIDIVDIWPDVYLLAFPNWLRKILKFFLLSEYCRLARILKKSSSLTAVSVSYLNWALMYAYRESSSFDKVFPLGYSSIIHDDQIVSQYQKTLTKKFNIDTETFVITFIGQFEKSYDIETIINAAKCLSSNSKIKFILAGNGSKYDKANIDASGYNNIYFTGWLSQAEIFALLRCSNLGLAAYSNSAPQSLPYKPFEYMSAGLPILSSLKGEIKTIIENYNIGRTYIAANVDSLCREINWFINNKTETMIMGQRARDLFLEKYSNEIVYTKFADHVSDIYKSFSKA